MEISRPRTDFWFACVDIAVIKDEKLSPCDKAIYMTLCAHAGVKTRKTPLSVKKLADETGCGVRTAQKSIRTLVERGVLERREQYKDGRQITSSYHLIGHNAECYRSTDITEESPHKNPVDDPTALEENDEPMDTILEEIEKDDVFDGTKSAEDAGNDISEDANSAGYVENCTPGGAESAHRYLEPVFNENKTLYPPTPKNEGKGEGADFESEKESSSEKSDKTHDTQERTNIPEIRGQEFYDAILNAYHAILPELSRLEMLTSFATELIEARIRESPEREKLDWWRRYFNRVREFPWPMGDNDKRWKSDFLWLLSAKGMEKINSEHFSRYPVNERTISECLERQRKYTDERGVVDGAAILKNC
jgi:DNA-binding Lrp family transcriptional regulator